MRSLCDAGSVLVAEPNYFYNLSQSPIAPANATDRDCAQAGTRSD